MKNLTFKIDHVLKTVEDFCQLMDRETAALEATNYKEFAALHENKIFMAQEYQDSIMSLEEDYDDIKNIDDALKEKLRAAHKRFEFSSNENESAIQTAMKTAERIVKMIMDAARRSVSDTPAYSAIGAQSLSEKIPVHFKLNEVL